MSRWHLARGTIDASFRSFRFLRTKTFSIISSKLEDEVENLRRGWGQLRLIYSSAKSAIEIAATIATERVWAGKVSRWLGDVDSLERDIKDIFTHIQRIHNQARSFSVMSWPSRYLLANDVIKTWKLSKDLIKKVQKYCAVADNAFERPLLLAYEVPVSETVGMDVKLKELMDCIGEENSGIIGLHGMGGSGKTTLMGKLHNNVFADVNIRHDFAQVIWIDVSEGCDIDKIIDDLRENCKIDDVNWEDKSRLEKARKIFNDLKGKKYILFVDGAGEEINLQSIGVPPPSKANQSKILITTRLENVCDQMKAKKFKMECLEENEALELLCMSAGYDKTIDLEHSSLRKVVHELSEECEGLPLALVAVGKAMAARKNPGALNHTLRKLKKSPWEVKGMVNNVFIILKSSYESLPTTIEKNCFLHCALLPKGEIIYVPDLIRRWIEKGLLGNHDSSEDALDHGEDVVESLKVASLVEDYGDNRIKMHKVIRNMALWLTREQDLGIQSSRVRDEASDDHHET